MVEISSDFHVQGEEVTFDQAARLQADGETRIAESAADIAVDFGGLRLANSLTVAIMLAWYRAAQRANKSIVFVNLSKELRNIVTFSGLAEVLEC